MAHPRRTDENVARPSYPPQQAIRRHIEEIAAELNVPVVGKMPIDMEYASKADSGAFDQIDNEYITKAVEVMPE